MLEVGARGGGQQSVIPEAFLVGGTAVGIYAPYRTSRDADHLMSDLPRHCTEVLARLEALTGWSTEAGLQKLCAGNIPSWDAWMVLRSH